MSTLIDKDVNMYLGFWLIVLIATPCVVILLSALVRSNQFSERINLLGSIMGLVAIICLLVSSGSQAHYYLNNYIIFDHLSGWVLLCTSIVYFLASLYSMGYVKDHYSEGRVGYYLLFSAFALAMLLAPLMNEIDLYWVCIDLTTIVSCFLICFKRSQESVEASWKYLVIVIAGLSLALLGILLFEWNGNLIAGNQFEMTWPKLLQFSPLMNTHLLVLAFLLVLIGFGTKVGLAPMHTWLSDAHSEGPPPASAMLSGALLNTAMLSLARFVSIMQHAGLSIFAHTMLVVFGILSLIIASFFIAKQTAVKRLMAYSSLEHMGVVALGFGFGGTLGIAGAMYHMLNHSLNKSLMFFGCGNVMTAYNSHDMADMRGVLKLFPKTGIIWLLGAIAIMGAPPGALFLSEMTIMRGGLASSEMWAVFIMLILLIVIFCGFIKHFFNMYFSELPANIVTPIKLSKFYFIPMILAVIPLFLLGFWWPESFWHYFMITVGQLT
jgi:hydrogenase-4 component F